jgi:poly(A) polymerase
MYGHAYDVATFRVEGPYLDGRHPSTVEFATPKQDATRRDFTINGLFYDPILNRVIDHVHGGADLRRRLLRTIGKPQDRFGEDKLRMLRAVRLACRLDFRIAPETFEAVRQLAEKILEVSWERIRDELLQILTGPAPDRGLDLLHESGLLAHVLPEVKSLVGVPQPEEYHPEGDVFVHTRNAVGLLRNPSPTLALATLLHDVGKPKTLQVGDRIRFHGHVEVGARMAEEVCARLRMSNEETARVVALVQNHLGFTNLREMRRSTLIRFLTQDGIEEHLEMHRVDCLSSRRSLESYRFARETLAELKGAPPRTPLPVTGDDLIGMGYKPGPLFGQILSAVEDLHLENPGLTREEAIDFVRRNYPLKDATE